jgi:hypothetical protein
MRSFAILDFALREGIGSTMEFLETVIQSIMHLF